MKYLYKNLSPLTEKGQIYKENESKTIYLTVTTSCCVHAGLNPVGTTSSLNQQLALIHE